MFFLTFSSIRKRYHNVENQKIANITNHRWAKISHDTMVVVRLSRKIKLESKLMIQNWPNGNQAFHCLVLIEAIRTKCEIHHGMCR
jgi:hypothetical protein